MDGGYAIAGYTYSFDPSLQAYLVKTDSTGYMQWNRTYGGANIEYAHSLVQTMDGGYAIAGTTSYLDPNGQAYLVKTDSTGNMQWNKTYGGIFGDHARSLVQMLDGSYAFVGHTNSFSASWQAYLVKADSEVGLCQSGATEDSIWLYRGITDPYWNYVRVRIWKIKE
jgi:hypothetical protein